MQAGKIRVGSRASQLALAQSRELIFKLNEKFPGLKFEIKKIETSGDKRKNWELQHFASRGIFTKEIEEALLRNEIDLAVHSLKDLPTQFSEELELVAVPERKNPSDAIVLREGISWPDLPAGARIGSSSLRRKAQLILWRKDIQVLPLRGNITTRLKMLKRGEYDAIIVAAAGLERLEIWNKLRCYVLPPQIMLPAPAQGALGIQIRKGEQNLKEMLLEVNHKDSFLATAGEREFLKRLTGGCRVPLASLARISGERMFLEGAVFSPRGDFSLRESLSGLKKEAKELGRKLAELLLEKGAGKILSSARINS